MPTTCTRVRAQRATWPYRHVRSYRHVHPGSIPPLSAAVASTPLGSHTAWASHLLGFTPLGFTSLGLHTTLGLHTSRGRIVVHAYARTPMHACTCTHAHARMHMHARPCTHAHARTPMHARISLGARAEPLRGWCARRESRQEAGRLHPPAPSAQAGRAPRAYR